MGSTAFTRSRWRQELIAQLCAPAAELPVKQPVKQEPKK